MPAAEIWAVATNPVITATSPTYAHPVPLSVTFKKGGADAAVTGFEEADLNVTNATVSDFNGSGPTYTFNLTPITDPATITLSIPAGVATNATDANATDAGSATIEFRKISLTRANDLVGHWKLDEGSSTIAADSSVSDKNGTIDLSNPQWIDAKFGKGLQLDGDDYVHVAGFDKLNNLGAGAVSFWVNPTNATSGPYVFYAPNLSIIKMDSGNVFLVKWYLGGGVGHCAQNFRQPRGRR